VRDVPPTSRLAREEVFGPVLAAMPFDDEAHAVALANGTDFGLVAGVWTRDGGRQLRMARAVRAGQVFINNYGAGGGVELPFGGVGQRPGAVSRRCTLHGAQESCCSTDREGVHECSGGGAEAARRALRDPVVHRRRHRRRRGRRLLGNYQEFFSLRPAAHGTRLTATRSCRGRCDESLTSCTRATPEHARARGRARPLIRVLKPGGHLGSSSDEDLYEQGVFPSTFTDHK
jgi:hypothetical protein